MKVASAERAELNPQKSQDETVTGMAMSLGDAICSPIQRPWRSTAPSHPSPPLPRERAVQAAGLAQGYSCTRGATSAERRRCCNLKRKKEQGVEGRTGKGSTLEQGNEKNPNQQPKMGAPREKQAPFVSSCFPLPFWFAKVLEVSASQLSAAVA